MNLRFQVGWSLPPEEADDTPGILDFRLDHEGDHLWIGRAPQADLRLPHPAVSQKHARVFLCQKSPHVEEAGSTNGTRLNGRWLEKGTPRLLSPGDTLSVGPFRLSVLAPSAEESTGKTSTACMARGLVRDWLAADPQALPHLSILCGPQKGAQTVVPLNGSVIAGRDPDCHVRLSDPDVSRHHARVRCDLEGAYLDDMGSKNGVWLEDQKISSPVRLRSGQVFTLGTTRIEYTDPAELYLQSLERMADRIMEEQHRTRSPIGPLDPQPPGLPGTAVAPEATDGQGKAPPDHQPRCIHETGPASPSEPRPEIAGATLSPAGPASPPAPSRPGKPALRIGLWIVALAGALAAAAALAGLVAVLMST